MAGTRGGSIVPLPRDETHLSPHGSRELLTVPAKRTQVRQICVCAVFSPAKMLLIQISDLYLCSKDAIHINCTGDTYPPSGPQANSQAKKKHYKI